LAFSDEEREHSHSHIVSETGPALRVKAIESLLAEKGLIDPAALDSVIDSYEHRIGPHIGARVVARAWLDTAFKQRLIADATSAVAELGIERGPQGTLLNVVENTPRIHNLVVCTLCSCYPWALLGLPPMWYKSSAYRSHAVRDPRAVLREFGVSLPDDVQVRVWDSSAEIRYLVLPMRPHGTEGLNEEQLAALVTREAMIGTGLVRRPAAGDGAEHEK
jgi:nitrile hydratase subunit alpha